jgi:hypothetical protein
MRGLHLLLAAIVLGAFACAPVSAQTEGSVGLGVSFGATFAEGSTPAISNPGGTVAFNWGFYVDIPLISTFHVTPSSELYRLSGGNATDIDLAFKFIVPLSGMEFFAGIVPGLTAVSTALDPHIGVLGGVSLKLISNLDVFAQAKYNILFDGGENMHLFHLNGGLLFKF